jgi:hypothetical protein
VADYEREGIAIFGLSYDSPDMLEKFTSKHGITYTLFSDSDSRAIRELRLLNRHIIQQQAAFGFSFRPNFFGLPYPGTFVLDEAGIVRERWFEQNYRIRPTAVTFLEESFNAAGEEFAVQADAHDDQVRASVWLGTPFYHPSQRLNLHVKLSIASGLHVYAEPIPDGYVPLSIEIEPIDGLEVRPLQVPTSQTMWIESLDETFHVLQGDVQARLPLIFTKNVGDVTVAARVSYQACTDRECFMPRTLALRFPIRSEENIRD